jgi:hypothetical protein
MRKKGYFPGWSLGGDEGSIALSVVQIYDCEYEL